LDALHFQDSIAYHMVLRWLIILPNICKIAEKQCSKCSSYANLAITKVSSFCLYLFYFVGRPAAQAGPHLPNATRWLTIVPKICKIAVKSTRRM